MTTLGHFGQLFTSSDPSSTTQTGAKMTLPTSEAVLDLLQFPCFVVVSYKTKMRQPQTPGIHQCIILKNSQRQTFAMWPCRQPDRGSMGGCLKRQCNLAGAICRCHSKAESHSGRGSCGLHCMPALLCGVPHQTLSHGVVPYQGPCHYRHGCRLHGADHWCPSGSCSKLHVLAQANSKFHLQEVAWASTRLGIHPLVNEHCSSHSCI